MRRRRLSEVWAWVAAAAAAVWRAITAVIGADELLVCVGLGLLTAGLWSLVQESALVAPGLVLLWIALPQRTPFVAGRTDTRQPPQEGA